MLTGCYLNMTPVPTIPSTASLLRPSSPLVSLSFKILQVIVLTGAWLFVIVSIGLLGFIVFTTNWSDPDTVCTLSLVSVDGIPRSVWGLTYHGFGGCTLAALEAAVLFAAIWSSTRATNLSRHIGLGVLLGWAGLWSIGTFWVSWDLQGLDFFAALTALPLFFAAGRAALCWKAGAPSVA
jgi:hypothetical protein